MIKILTIKEIKNNIKNIRPKHIMKNTGLSRTTIKNLTNGIDKNYKILTILKITKYINKFKNNYKLFNNKKGK